MTFDNLSSGALGAVIGVIISSIINYKLNLKAQNTLIRKKINVDKLSMLIETFYEYFREFMQLENITVKLISGKIDLDTYRNLEDKYQDEIIQYKRKIKANFIYMNDLKDKYDEIINIDYKVCNLIYDKYYNLNSRIKHYNPDDYTFKDIEDQFNKVIILGDKLIENLQLKLQKELGK